MGELIILYEDNHIIVVLKPQNMPCCEDESGDFDLLSAVKGYVKETYGKKGNVYIGLVHRLDRPTGGVMVFAKSSKAAARLSEQMKGGDFEKKYGLPPVFRMSNGKILGAFIITRDGEKALPLMSKEEAADALLTEILARR